jgi:hypothetical protein
MNSSSPYVFVVKDIPEEITREQLIDFYSNSISVARMKIYKIGWPASSKICRLAAIGTNTFEDTFKASFRFLGSLTHRAKTYYLKHDAAFTKALIHRPLEISVEIKNQNDEMKDQIVSQLNSLGHVKLISEEVTEDGLKLGLSAGSDYLLSHMLDREIVLNQIFDFKFKIEEEELQEEDLQRLIEVVETFFHDINSISSPGQTTTKGDDSLSLNTRFIMFSSSTMARRHQIDAGIIGQDDDLSLDEDDDCQQSSTNNTGVYLPQLVDDYSCVSHFDGRIVNPLSRISENIPDARLSQVPHESNVVSFTVPHASPDILASLEEKTHVANLKNQERTLEVMRKLQKLGIKIDEAFFVSVKTKIDPRTPEYELLRVALKIVKTKLRKIKRRDRKRAGKKSKDQGSDSEDDDDDDSEKDGPKTTNVASIDSKVQVVIQTVADLSIYPVEWVSFVKSLQPQRSKISALPASLKCLESDPISPEAKDTCEDASRQNICRFEEAVEMANNELQAEENNQENSKTAIDSLFFNFRLNYMEQELREQIVAGLEARLQFD